MIAPEDAETRVRIRAVNTEARVEAVIQTPGGRVRYDGEAAIDGAPGTAAPIRLNFMNVAGSATGALRPTGSARDEIEGIEVSCIDVAMPVCVARAEAFGLTGYESREALEENRAFFERFEAVRREAGRRMGMGDVSGSVTPKFAIVAPARAGGSFAARYFTPVSCHPTMAVTGAQCLAACGFDAGLGGGRPDGAALLARDHLNRASARRDRGGAGVRARRGDAGGALGGPLAHRAPARARRGLRARRRLAALKRRNGARQGGATLEQMIEMRVASGDRARISVDLRRHRGVLGAERGLLGLVGGRSGRRVCHGVISLNSSPRVQAAMFSTISR